MTAHIKARPNGKFEAGGKITDRAIETQSTAPDGHLVAQALVYPPSARRHLWLLLVPSCPSCGGAHTHRARRLHGRMARTGSCGRAYRLAPTVVLRGDRR